MEHDFNLRMEFLANNLIHIYQGPAPGSKTASKASTKPAAWSPAVIGTHDIHRGESREMKEKMTDRIAQLAKEREGEERWKKRNAGCGKCGSGEGEGR
jgi:hypothetical protein